MILSLVFATIVTVPTIAIIGISKVGPIMLGSEGTATSYANATMWSTYSSFGLSLLVPIVAGGGIVLAFLVCAISKLEKKEAKT